MHKLASIISSRKEVVFRELSASNALCFEFASLVSNKTNENILGDKPGLHSSLTTRPPSSKSPANLRPFRVMKMDKHLGLSVSCNAHKQMRMHIQLKPSACYILTNEPKHQSQRDLFHYELRYACNSTLPLNQGISPTFERRY